MTFEELKNVNQRQNMHRFGVQNGDMRDLYPIPEEEKTHVKFMFFRAENEEKIRKHVKTIKGKPVPRYNDLEEIVNKLTSQIRNKKKTVFLAGDLMRFKGRYMGIVGIGKEIYLVIEISKRLYFYSWIRNDMVHYLKIDE
jgi:hypothetical protein